MSRAARRATVLGALSCVLVMSATAAAQPAYQCGDQTDDCQCGANNPFPCCDNGGNCTWWAWEAACCNWAVVVPMLGNANQWAGDAELDPNYDVLSSPVVDSIACRVSGTYGHVAWVTAVNGSTITVTEENCCTGCNYGLRTATYDASYFDGGYIVRAGQCACSAGQTQSDACGNCGTRERSCGGDCQWGDWSSCSGEGECAKGTTDEQSCSGCGTQVRSCDDSCQWGDFGECLGAEACADAGSAPDGSAGTGGTGTGGAGTGGAGTGGAGTGGAGTGGAGTWPEAGSHDTGTAGTGQSWATNTGDASGCACRSTGPRQGSTAAALTALVALALTRRRRR